MLVSAAAAWAWTTDSRRDAGLAQRPIVGAAAGGASAAAQIAPAPQTASPSGFPRVLLFGGAQGQLEPCGCSGGQFGGIDRLATMLAAESQSGAGLRVAAGAAIGPEARELHDWAQAQLATVWSAYGMLELAAVGLGSADLCLPLSEVAAYAPALGGAVLVATNLRDSAGAAPFASQWIDPASGLAVLCLLPAGLNGPGWRTVGWREALAAVQSAATLAPALVLLEGTSQDAAALAPLLPQGGVIALFGPKDDASHEASLIPGGAAGAEVDAPPAQAFPVAVGVAGSRLRHVARLQALPGGGWSWEALPVSQDVPGAADLEFWKEEYRGALAAADVVGQLGGSRGAHARGAFAGSSACLDCHEDEWAIWLETAHSHALTTLAEDLRGSQPASVDPRCVSCHVVGLGHTSGFASPELPDARRRALESDLAGVGCESCHGPGAAHAASQEIADILRADAATCEGCHDAENDPNFDFARKWPLVRHGDGP